MQGNVPVESVEKGDAVTDQDGEDGIAKFVGQPAAKAFARDGTTANKPDVAKSRLQPFVDKLLEITRVELNGTSRLSELAMGQHEGRFIAVGPTQPPGVEIQRRLIGPRTHDVAVDRSQELGDRFRRHQLAAFEAV